MDELNDVVRHVILRILVDQAGLAESLAAAREKLKALKDSERQINQDRAKNHETLTRAIEAQNQAFDKNRQAEEAYQRSTENRGKTAAEQVKANTAALNDETKGIQQRTVEEAKAAQISSKTRQQELDAQRARSAAKKKDADDDVKRAQNQQALEEQIRQYRLRADAERKRFNQETADKEAANAVKNAGLKEKLDAEQKQRDLDARARRKRDNDEAAAEVEKLLQEAGKVNAQANAIRSKAKTGREESSARVDRQDYESIAKVERQDTVAEASVNRADVSAQAKQIRDDIDAADRRDRLGTESVAKRDRLDAESSTKRRLQSLKVTSDVERAEEESGQRIFQRQETHEERLTALRRLNQQKVTTQVLTDIEKVAQAQAQRTEVELRSVDAQERREATRPGYIAAERAKSASAVEIAGAKTDVAQSQAQVAAARAETAERQAQITAARALNEEDKVNTEIGTRRERTEVAIARAKEDIRKVAAQTGLIEERTAAAAERRARLGTSSRRRNTTASQAAEDLATNVGRGIGTLLFSGPENTRFDNARKAMRDVREEGGRARDVVSTFFGVFRKGEHEAASVLKEISTRIRSFYKELKPATSGGGNLFGNIINNIGDLTSAFGRGVGDMSKHMLSFRGLIIAVVAAFGPLMAILGALGAAALGLASNIAALSGAFYALPGLLSAAIAGFGALAIVMKPITNVFSALTAAQKESTKATNQEIRAQQGLADARVQAKRKIEDYQTALKNLKLQEEGAALGVAAAKQAYMQALVDPTSSALDVAQAKLAYQQAIADQQQQKTDATRTRQDANIAISRGVEGSSEVQSAKDTISSTPKAQLQAALDKLPAQTRKVIEAIIALQGKYKDLRNSLSENIFGTLSTQTGKFKDILAELGTFLTPASKALGTLATNILNLLTTPEFKSFIATQGEAAGKLIGSLGRAAISAAKGFMAITEAARPFTQFVADGIAKVAESFSKWAGSDKGRQSIIDFLKITEQRIREILPIVGNFVAGFVGFFNALNAQGTMDDGSDFTTKFNKGLLGISEKFRKLGEMAADPNSGFRRWLHDVWPLLQQIGHFIGAVGRFFGDLFSDPDNIKEAENLLHNIADKWLPALARIFDGLSRSQAISKLSSAIGNVFSFIQQILDHGGIVALQGLATILDGIASTIDWLTQHIPGLSTVLGFLAVAFSAALGAGLIVNLLRVLGKLTGINAILKAIWGQVSGGGTSGGSPGTSPTKPTPTPGGGGGGGGAAATGTEVEIEESQLLVLRRIEAYARQIAINTGGTGAADTTINENEKNKPGTKPKPGDVIDDVEKDVKTTTPKGSKFTRWIKKLLPGTAAEVAEDAAAAAAVTAGTSAAASKSGGFFSGIKKFFTGGGSKTATTAATAAEEAGTVASSAGKLATIGKFAKGPAAIAAAIAAQVGGSLLIDNFVKNDKDKSSLQRGLNNVATGTGLGFQFGGPIGAALGYVGTAGYSLATDKNLRSFVADKGVGGSLGNMLFGTKDGQRNQSTTSKIVTSAIKSFVNTTAGPIGLAAGLVDTIRGTQKPKPATTPGAKQDTPWYSSLTGGLIPPDVGKSVTDGLSKAGTAVANFFTKTIPGLASSAAGAIGGFFTKTIPNAFDKAVSGISNFFTKTLPGLPKKAIGAIIFDFGRLWVIFAEQLPRIIRDFFTKTIPNAASKSWNYVKHDLWDPFAKFVTKTAPDAIRHFFTSTVPEKARDAWNGVKRDLWEPFIAFVKGIPGFFTKTIPQWFSSTWHWFTASVYDPVKNFITTTVPKFFTDTIPKWFAAAPGWFKTHVKDPVTDFFTVTVPNFFTQTLPAAIKGIPGWMYTSLVKPVTDFFGGLASHVHITDLFSGAKDLWNWAKGLFEAGEQAQRGEAKMSGGLIAGVYQGIEDKAHVMATPGEFMFRKRVVDQPGAKAIMHDWNEGRIDVSSLYQGLSATAAPPTMSIVPPAARSMTGSIPTVVNHTVNHAPVFGGDVTINNPHREKAEWSLRRRLEVAANRHRR